MTINFLQQAINVAFNMATQIAYEKIMEKPFELSELKYAENRMALYYAMILANNPETTITIDEIINHATLDDINTIDNAANVVMSEWYKIPATLSEPNTSQEDDEEGAEKKA